MIEIIKLDEPSSKQKRDCKCQYKCKEYYRINGFDVYCKGVMEQLAVDIFNACNGTKIANGNFNQRGWTTVQELQLIDFIEKNGVKYGTYRILGEIFHKERSSVKYKVYALEKQGRIKKEWLMNGTSENTSV